MARPQSLRDAGLWLAVLGATIYAGLATGIALDRATASRPELTNWVPGPFRQQVLAKAAGQKLLSGQAAAALPLAEQLLRKDPLSPHAAGLLGTIRLESGDQSGAARAFRTSAKLGWRDAPTQLFWFDAAVRAADFARAAMRFEALARQWPHAPAIDQLAVRLESDPRGFSVLARQAASGDSWVTAYATPRANQPEEALAGRARVLASAGKIGGQLGCERIAPLVNALWERRPVLAGEVWASQCDRAALPGVLANGGFEAQPIPAQATVFEWQFPGNGALDAAIVADGKGGHALQVRSTAASLVPVAMQRIVLKPGSYRISWFESGIGPSRLAASLSCKADRSEADPQPGAGISATRSAAVIARGNCPVPVLQLWLRPGAAAVSIDNVAIHQS